MFIDQPLRLLLGVCLAGVIFGASCTAPRDANNAAPAANAPARSDADADNANLAKDDTAELGSLVLLPFVPVESVYREEANAAQPQSKKLTAVLKFTAEESQRLIENALKYRPAETVRVSAEDWFPAELVAQTTLSGDETLQGTAYAPTDFMQMPYKSGRLVKIDNSEYFLLEVTTN